MILGRAYLREIALHLFMVLGGVTMLVALGAAVRASSISQGAPIWFTLALLPLLVGNVLPYLVSVTLLVAVIITYGRMAADREEVALRCSGIHPFRIMTPALVAGTLVAAVTYPFAAVVVPEIYSSMRNLSFRLRYAALENVNPSASELHVQGLTLMWNGRDPDGTFRDVTLFSRESAGFSAFPGDPEADVADDEALGEVAHLRADRGRMYLDRPYLVFQFDGARTFDESAGDEAWSLDEMESFILRIDLDRLQERPERERKPDDYRSSELREALASGLLEDPTASRFAFTYWRRGAIAFSAIPLALLGAMLGWRLRRGGFMAALAAAFSALFTFFYPFYFLGESLLKSGSLDPVTAAWLPVIALVPVLFALSRVPRLS